jgi:hypothetical protein
MNLFKRPRTSEEPEIVVPQAAADLVPASAKSPDAQRRNLFNPEEEIDENSDEDLAFLNGLINDDTPPIVAGQERKVGRGAVDAKQPSVQNAPPRGGDDLDVFREMAALRTRTELAKQLRVDDVEMGDLIEELQTTRAALRHLRKAA